MASLRIVCRAHTMQEFYKNNKEFINDTNINFSCDRKAYGSHRIYFCL